MKKTCVLVYRHYDYYQSDDVLFAGTEKQCLQFADEYVWKDPDGSPACFINPEHKNRVYTIEDEPGVNNSFLLLLEF
jgi:hypothetical protein